MFIKTQCFGGHSDCAQEECFSVVLDDGEERGQIGVQQDPRGHQGITNRIIMC